MDPERPLSHDEKISMLFANMVMQQANTALIFMGKVKHPETGETTTDLEAARFFIDQLEMVSVKTKGNLNKDEENLLQQSLMTVRMAFVETFSGNGGKPQQPAVEGAAPAPSQPAATEPAQAAPNAETAPHNPPTDEDGKKKFVKKY